MLALGVFLLILEIMGSRRRKENCSMASPDERWQPIVFGDDNVEDLNSLSAALRMAEAGELEAWVHGYLLSAGRIRPFPRA